jgi:Co/Zn/Cd efflux system component
MFLVESIAGIVAHSTALLADSIDMLGDAIVYGFSLYVIERGAVWKARAPLLKGIIMAVFGIGIVGQVAAHDMRRTRYADAQRRLDQNWWPKSM